MKTYRFKNIFLSACTLVAIAACSNDDNDGGEVVTPPIETLDFSGTYAQADHMGRPGINTVLSGTEDIKNAQNTTLPADMQAAFQDAYINQAVALHAAYGAEYETNILGLDAGALTGILSEDVLEVAPNAVTAYFVPGEDADMDGNALNDPAVIGLTGRTIQDDVIDVSLILLFGGMEGNRFSGQDTDDDGMSDLPRLTSDGVGITASPSSTFPYLGNPE